jgi:hypothetical protein
MFGPSNFSKCGLIFQPAYTVKLEVDPNYMICPSNVLIPLYNIGPNRTCTSRSEKYIKWKTSDGDKKTSHSRTKPGGLWTFLTFMEPCIANAFLSTTNKIQRYTMFFIVVSALHVVSGFCAHHQALKNCTCSIRYLSDLRVVTASLVQSELIQASGNNTQV